MGLDQVKDQGNSNLPPPSLLDSLRQPRRRQIHDPCVQDLLRRWKRLGGPIEYGDLNDVAEMLAPGVEPNARTRERIVAAVEAAGIRINNFDGYRQTLAERNIHVSLTGQAMFEMAEEWRWRHPHEYDNRPTTQQVRTAMMAMIEELASKHDKSQTHGQPAAAPSVPAGALCSS